VFEQKKRNGIVSILWLTKVKGIEVVLILAENGPRRVRNNLPSFGN
jgi:hypothetical protein